MRRKLPPGVNPVNKRLADGSRRAYYYFRATGERLPDPDLAEQYALIVEHYHAMIDHYGSQVAVPIARKHIGWYTKGLHGSAEFRNAVNKVAEAEVVLDMLDAFYAPLLAGPEPALAAA